jgi:hypothetical protein
MTYSPATIRSRRKSCAVSGAACQHLQRVDGGGQQGVLADQTGLDQQGELQVGEAADLAHPGALAVDRHAAADHQVTGRGSATPSGVLGLDGERLAASSVERRAR